ncbi:ABC transporter ATP-binding protein [Parasedimentitalea psychrophila]|uniref:ABC transporter ATP-binding protein n=1 Tax=Parasedimentitalea psychrophila TaxID=2997337 RepID=A0A9Y2P673_9RHOB|nr:ABC transporter ATP-binding protein [Parasedimentitalea psychrophila]WIY24375.1 ABC transporter ATP-binding protein [Parasedimentitalea psychrophila]
MNAADLIAENLSWGPRKNQPLLLHPTSFEVNAGQVLGVVGPNGAGKSTLLRMIYRYHTPSSGHIHVDGQDIWAMPPRAAARKVAAVLQEQPTSFGLTVREVVALGRTPHRLGYSTLGAQDAEIVDEALSRLDLQSLSFRDLLTLSGGERQRVMVARALAQQPQVLVLDEPTNHLDIRHQLEVLALIRELDLTIVVSLHDLNMASQICDRILLLENGHTMGFGLPETVLTEAKVSDAFRIDARREYLRPSNTQHLSFHLPDQRGTL